MTHRPSAAPVEGDDALPARKVIDGRYRLKRVIGRGGMSAVYEAEHLFTGRSLAVKMLLTEYRHSPDARERILREGRVLATVRSEHVVEVIDAGVSEGDEPFVVMEKLEGRSLEGLLAAKGKLGVAEALHVVRRAALATAASHRRGIIHRDIKPGNIFIVHGGNGHRGDRVRLVDFGVATAHEDEGRPKLTGAGIIVGTPEYLAPEMMLGHPGSPATDAYALGIVLFECLTGTMPFTGNYAQRLIQITAHDPPDVRAYRSDVDDAVATLVSRALARDCSARIPNAEALADAIAALGREAPELHLLRHVPPPLPLSSANRRHARVPYVAPLHLEIGETGLEARAEDISVGGLLALVQGHVAVGAHVGLRFTTPIGGRVVRARGLVRWVRRAERMARYNAAVGIEFLDLPPDAEQEIRTYVTTLASSGQK